MVISTLLLLLDLYTEFLDLDQVFWPAWELGQELTFEFGVRYISLV